MEIVHILIHVIAFGVLGCAASSLNTSGKSTLTRPGYWVVMVCGLVIFFNTFAFAK